MRNHRHRELERTDLGGLSVSRLALGSGRFNRDFPVDEIVDAYRGLGGNFIDTAHCYSFWLESGAGASERSIADYFKRNGGRDGIIVATKGGHPSAPGYRTTRKHMSPERIRADIDDSLARLEFDHIDLYWLHRDDESVPVSEIVDFLNEEVDLGRISELGASNWSTPRIEAANQYASKTGKKGFVASQVELNLAFHPQESNGMRVLWRDRETAWHTRTQFPVVAYSSTAHGYFAGSGDRRYESPATARRLEKAGVLAEKYSLTPHQIAVAFVASQPFPTVPIVGTGDVEHLREAAEAVGTVLDAKDLEWLTA